ncbi:hypothetical protein MPSI1_001699 [Malassezia psittaci]|uniref:RING-type domain-containing protein n=1 Tax=Malassezia psittaci TaxID=1821823 RepID=A0AAF0JDV7_9BASI|nr:hypothetical protein MPSI1_001699 [Malassezia psittaci]
MGASHSRNVRESRSGAPDRRAPRRTREESESSTNQDTSEPYLRRRRLGFSRSLGLPREDTDVDGSLRAARVFPRNLRRHWGRASSQESSQLAFAPPSTDINIAQQRPEPALSFSSPMSETREPDSTPSSALDASLVDSQSRQSQPAANVEEQNAQPTPPAGLDQPQIDPRPAPSLFASSVSPTESSLTLPSHPRLNPHSLRGTASPDESRANRAQRAEAFPGSRGAPPSSAFGTLLSEVLGASREAHSGPSSNMPVSGTSVIVQGALVARTAPSPSSSGSDAQQAATPSGESASESASRSESSRANPALDPNAFSSSNNIPGTQFGPPHTGDQPGSAPGPEVPHVATLEEQGEMLGRILRIATAATAASLISPGSSALGRPPTAAASDPANANETNARQSSNSTRPQEPSTASTASTATSSGPNTGSSIGSTATSSATESSESQRTRPDTSRSASGRLGSELLERLASLSSRGNTDETSQRRDSAPESGAMSTISRLMRDALRTSSPPPPRPSSDQAHERGPVVSNVLSILDRARQGDPLTEGEPDSFERFLHDLILDLSAAVMELDRSNAQTSSGTASDPASTSSTRASGPVNLPDVVPAGDHDPSSENGAVHPDSTQTGDATDRRNTESSSRQSDLDPRVLARREGDLSWGQLSFFRLFRFERNAQSLIPCVLVGVRSLRPDERLMGTEERTEEGLAGTSRFVLFVSGGRYHDQHPLLTARPRDAGRDLMFMMELLGTMVAMSSKPQTASASEIARSGLPLVKADELPRLHREGKVTENTSEKCLVCLEDWQPTDECRILNCHHAFHSGCVDQWLEKSSNSCPLCMY